MAQRWRQWCASREHCANPRPVGSVGGVVAAINLVPRVPVSTSVYIARVTEAHQPWFGWAPPIRARCKGPFDPLGSNGREINLTFSPLISTLLLTLYFILYSFHHGSVHRACFIVTARLPIESDSHYTLFCFETNSVTFGPLMIQES